MRFFSAELAHNYGTYTFGYANYCRIEKGDDLVAAYAAGYLPYSGAKGVLDLCYMARSARVDLSRFEPSSENRRVAKKFDGAFLRREHDIAEMERTGSRALFLQYFSKRHGTVMPPERLDAILKAPLPLLLVTYHEGERLVAAVLEVTLPSMAHFWFSAYAMEYEGMSLGLWLMLDRIRAAKEQGRAHYYLGTVYGEKALYKTNFEPLEWWTGGAWSAEASALRKLSRSDGERAIALTDAGKDGFEAF